MHALNRLGMIMAHQARAASAMRACVCVSGLTRARRGGGGRSEQGKLEERAALVAEALAVKERLVGSADSPALAHEVQVLANVLGSLGRHDEALPLLRRALALNRKATSPKGEPLEHLVAASLGDLGCARLARGARRGCCDAPSCTRDGGTARSAVREDGGPRGGDGAL